MPCLIALIVLSILSIFSLKYRILAKEAFDCVFRRITFRPCQTGFNQKVKTGISSWFLRKSEKIGGFVFKYFEILSWVFVIVFSITTFYVGRSVYFYAKYGSCTPEEPQNCVVNGLISPEPNSSQTEFPPCEEYNAKSTKK